MFEDKLLMMLKVIFIISVILLTSGLMNIAGQQEELQKSVGIRVGSIHKFSMESLGNITEPIHRFDLSQKEKYDFSLEIISLDNEGNVIVEYKVDLEENILIPISLSNFGDPIVYLDWDYWENKPTEIIYVKPPNETRIIENRVNEFYHKYNRYNNGSFSKPDLVYNHYGFEDVYDKKTGIVKKSSFQVEKIYKNGSHTNKILNYELQSSQPPYNKFSLPYYNSLLSLVIFSFIYRKRNRSNNNIFMSNSKIL